MLVDSSIVRLTWAIVEKTSTADLLTLNDTALVRLLLQQIANRILLDSEEIYVLYGYIGSRTTLIRDMAAARLLDETSPLPGSPNALLALSCLNPTRKPEMLA